MKLGSAQSRIIPYLMRRRKTRLEGRLKKQIKTRFTFLFPCRGSRARKGWSFFFFFLGTRTSERNLSVVSLDKKWPCLVRKPRSFLNLHTLWSANQYALSERKRTLLVFFFSGAHVHFKMPPLLLQKHFIERVPGDLRERQNFLFCQLFRVWNGPCFFLSGRKTQPSWSCHLPTSGKWESKVQRQDCTCAWTPRGTSMPRMTDSQRMASSTSSTRAATTCTWARWTRRRAGTWASRNQALPSQDPEQPVVRKPSSLCQEPRGSPLSESGPLVVPWTTPQPCPRSQPRSRPGATKEGASLEPGMLVRGLMWSPPTNPEVSRAALRIAFRVKRTNKDASALALR